MLALGVIAAVGAVAAIVRYFQVRDDVPPMQRHARAIEALRDLAEHPSPAVDLAVQPEQPIDHVRILDDVPAVPRRARRASTSRAPATRRGARSRSTVTADRPTIQIRASAERATGLPTTAVPTGADPGGWPRRSGFGMRAVVGAGAAVVAITVVAIVVGSGGNRPRGAATPTTATARTSPTAAATTTVPTTSTSALTVAAPVVARTATGATVTAHAPFRLTLRATGTSWVQITDRGGTTLFATTMHAGGSQDIPVTRPVTLHLGYAPAVTLSVDGVALDPTALAQVGTIELQTT